MKRTGLTKVFTVGAVIASVAMIVTMLMPAPSAEAQYSSTPCPHYAIQDVFDDPSGNWDGDQVNNADELYNGLNPCIVDTTTFCAGGGNSLCRYPTYTSTYTYYPSACQSHVSTYPNGDYDGDGVANAVEARNYANPCSRPCPHPTNADLALNPNGDWDGDTITNAVEVNQGTDPCNAGYYNPCPYYSAYQVDYMPHGDWDGDGVSNATEVYRGTNPCVYNYAPSSYTPVVKRLPHVTTVPTVVYVPVKPTCPYNYPYYHTGNGLCYANPVTPWR